MSAEPTTSAALQSSLGGRRLDGRRVLPALVFIPLFYALVRYAPPAAFFVLVAAAACLALAELYKLHFREARAAFEILLGLVACLALLGSFEWPGLLAPQTAVLLALGATLVSRLVTRRDVRFGLGDSAVLLLGVVYIGYALGHLLLLRGRPEGDWLVFFVFLVTWAGDTGAYYAGITLGRHKLAPVISPKKTLEGLVGGLLLAVAAAMLARVWFLPSFTLADSLVTGILLTLAGVLGDLVESAMKRSAGVKDSGSVIPAHGGMLDRIDSLLFTGPTLYYYVTLVKG